MRGIYRKLACIAAAMLMTLFCAPAPGQRRERKRVERAEISVLEQQWQQAQVSDNIAEMDRLLAEDFLGVTASGQVVTKAQQLNRMRTRRIDLRRIDVVDSKVKISGNVAVVTSLAEIDGMMDGRPLEGSFRYIRVYRRGPSTGWRITNFEATRVPQNGARVGLKPPPAVGEVPHAGAPSFLPASQVVPLSPRPQS